MEMRLCFETLIATCARSHASSISHPFLPSRPKDATKEAAWPSFTSIGTCHSHGWCSITAIQCLRTSCWQRYTSSALRQSPKTHHQLSELRNPKSLDEPEFQGNHDFFAIMRLIDTSNIAFQEFPGLEQPPYAVVSHRWSDDEPNHQEFLESKPTNGYGWTKILKGCEIARLRGIQWLWCDTVCIDKKSSAELSEAINSMFYWYEHAFECYVFLPDVPPVSQSTYRNSEKEPHRNTAGVQFYLEDFQSSVWFTRGWALQELLAPRIVNFYNSQFDFIETKVGLQHEIALITGIHAKWLHRTSINSAAVLQQASVAERMKWAAFRQTTRLEDAAYCMMGIFDVNMPLLYGEGSKAFMRLQLEIIRKCDDESIFAWFAPDMPSWQGLLAPSPRAFRFPGNETIVVAHHQPRAPFQMTNKGLQLTLSVPEATRMPDYGQGRVSILLPLNCETILLSSNKNGSVGGSRRQMAIRVSVRMIGRSKPPIFEGRPFREQQAEHQLLLANTIFNKPKEYGCSCINGVPDRNRPLKPWVVYFRQDGV